MLEKSYQILSALTAIILVIVLLGYILRKLPITKKYANNAIKIIYTQPLSSKEKLFLIEIESTCLLLSSSINGIQKIHTFEKTNNDDLLDHPVPSLRANREYHES